MKIICEKDQLLLGVNTVQKAVSSKSTLPILQGIKIRTTENGVWFEATDLELGIRCEVPVNVLEQGEVVLPARLFSEIVRKLPDTEIRIESTDKNITLYYQQSDFGINGFDPEEFPEIGDISGSEVIELSAELFRGMIKKTIFACSGEESRPVFTGILLHIEKDQLYLVSTDTHRLAYAQEKVTENEKEFHGIIPAKTMQEIVRLLGEEETIQIQFSKSRLAFHFGSVHIITRLIEGQFPNHKQVIPQNCHTKLLVNNKKLLDTVERASLLSRDNYLKTNTVRFQIENSVIHINQTTEIGKISEQIEVGQEGENVSISFNAKYIIDLLKAIETENVIMEASGTYSPTVFRPTDDEDYLCLVLPLRN